MQLDIQNTLCLRISSPNRPPWKHSYKTTLITTGAPGTHYYKCQKETDQYLCPEFPIVYFCTATRKDFISCRNTKIFSVGTAPNITVVDIQCFWLVNAEHNTNTHFLVYQLTQLLMDQPPYIKAVRQTISSATGIQVQQYALLTEWKLRRTESNDMLSSSNKKPILWCSLWQLFSLGLVKVSQGKRHHAENKTGSWRLIIVPFARTST